MLQARIEAESREYGDILQISLPDGYRNLSYKSISGLLWLSQNYPQARYIGKSLSINRISSQVFRDIVKTV